jgi:hypothetical protein
MTRSYRVQAVRWVCRLQQVIQTSYGLLYRGLYPWGYSGRGVKLTTHPHLVPKSRMRGAIPPFPRYVFMAWWLVKHRDNFSFYLYLCWVSGARIVQWYSTRLQVGWSGGRVPAGAGNFSLHHRVQTGSGGHPASYPLGTRGSFPGGKAAGEWNWPLTSI